MKKFFAVMLSLMLMVLTFASCQSTDKTSRTPEGRGAKSRPEFGKMEIRCYFCRRKDGRAVDCGGLENR